MAIDRFEDVRRRAQINRLWQRLARKRKALLPFAPIYSRLSHPNGISQGITEIPVRRIVGSLTQAPEFDRNFRPLHKHQRERWAKVWALHTQRGWEPIKVHQIGGLYFVEDGHHRTSVAHDLGLETIEAAVTAYPLPISLNPYDSLEEILAKLDSASFGSETDRSAMKGPSTLPLNFGVL